MAGGGGRGVHGNRCKWHNCVISSAHSNLNPALNLTANPTLRLFLFVQGIEPLCPALA